MKAVREIGMAARQELGPGDTTIWHLQAGGVGFDQRAEVLEFLPEDLTVQQGDTVIWTSLNFHNITFHPGTTPPEFVVPMPQEAGPPILSANPQVVFPAKPSGEFDGTGFFSSGLVGPELPGGTTFAMTFSEVGTFDYICAVHRELGMEGTITVVAP